MRNENPLITVIIPIYNIMGLSGALCELGVRPDLLEPGNPAGGRWIHRRHGALCDRLAERDEADPGVP